MITELRLPTTRLENQFLPIIFPKPLLLETIISGIILATDPNNLDHVPFFITIIPLKCFYQVPF